MQHENLKFLNCVFWGGEELIFGVVVLIVIEI